MKRLQLLGTAIIGLVSLTASAEVNPEYYLSLNGLSGAQLKTAIHELCRAKLQIPSSINSTYSGLSTTFRETDFRVIDGVEYWWDMYSTTLNPLSKTFSECSYQREHAFPKSWWKDTDQGVSDGVSYTTAYCDMHHLYPSNGPANQSKSNWPLGIVGNATFDNGTVKTGVPASGVIYGIDDTVSKVFEPADEYKGDFARAYMYVVTAYQDLTWADNCLWMVQRDLWPTFTDWARALVGDWHRADAVSKKETDRNDAVEAIQHNRNPFIDMPNLYEYVWGDSIDTPLNVYTTVKSTASPAQYVQCTFYSAKFTGGDHGDCSIEDGDSQDFDVWQLDNTYGWKGSGYNSGTRYATDSRLVTPEIDLTVAQEAVMTFSHAINYSDASPMKVYVRTDDGRENDITPDLNWPQSQSWKFVDSGQYDLSKYSGKKVRVVFHYTSTPTVAGTWEIKNLDISGTKRATSVATEVAIGEGAESAPEYYTIDGRRVNPDTYRGFAIRRQGSKAVKMLLR